MLIADSLITAIKNNVDNYLQTTSDTLHDCLNIYLQQKEKKMVDIFRFDKDLKLIAFIEKVDIARLNSLTDFENELYYFKNVLYTIKNQNDSNGRQFYLNKYSVKSLSKNFEYDFTWQFPFERKNIQSAHIFYADKKVVLLYVNVSGSKIGQWILSIDVETGKLIKGSKLNEPFSGATCAFGDFIADTLRQTLTLLGQKFTSTQINQTSNVFNFSNASYVTFYLVEMDSLYTVTDRLEFKIPVVDNKIKLKTQSDTKYLLRINNLKKNNLGGMSFNADIFKNQDRSLSFNYCNTNKYILDSEDGSLVMQKSSVSSNPMIENYYYPIDKLTLDGKLAVDSISDFEKLFYKKIAFPLKLKFKIDFSGNLFWILSKSDSKTNSVNYSYLTPKKKIYQISPLENLPKSSRPSFANLDNDRFLIGRQSTDFEYEIKAYRWPIEK
jgi:hypothetical protein